MTALEIGEEKRVIEVTPVREPVPSKETIPDSPAELPEFEPEREKVPA